MLSLRRLAVSVAVPAVAGVLVAAQTPAPGVQPPRDTSAQTNRAPAPVPTGKISGRVTAADTGRAVRAARVTLSGNQAGGGGRSASTDENGAFTFTALPDGRYTVNASRTGFVTASYGQRRPLQPGIPLQLTAGAALQNIDIKLPRGSAIAGHVYDENGEPAPATMIQVMRYQFQNGERRLMPAGNAQTNDKGEYRVWGLNPGDYYVSAQVPNIAGLVEGVVGGLGGGRGGRGGAPGAPGGPGGAGGPGGPGGGRGARGGLQIDLNGLTFDATQALGALDVQSILGNFGGLMNTQDGDGAVAYAPTFYPGVTAPGEARAVTVPLGGEALGVDFSLLLVRLSRVTGRAINPDGTAAVAGNATLVAEGQGRGGAFSNYGGRIVREGTFTIGNVPPGRYTLRVRSGGQGPNAADGGRGGRGNPGTNGRGRGAAPAADTAPALFAYQPLTVAGDIPDLTVALAPGATLEGTVTLEVSQAAATTTNGQNSRPPDVTQVRVNAQPVDTSLGASGNSRVNADGKFTIDNVPPGQHWLRAQAPRGLTVKSIVVAGRDVTDIPVDVRSGETMTGVHVTFTDRVSEITGTITDSRSAPVTDFTVLAFPQDPDLWRPQARQIMTARPDQNGKYYLRGLPPGRYYLVTIDPATPGEWFDPAYLDARKDGAARFSLGEGETKTQDFRLPAQ